MPLFKQSFSSYLSSLKDLIYNNETNEILGRTPVGWLQLGAFYLVFYVAIGSFFAAHLAIFVGITPSPAPEVTPWNFGRYAYPNYPNAKIGMMAIPTVVIANGTYATYGSESRESLMSLSQSAVASGVECMNDTTENYGYVNNRACVLLRIAKVFEWTPESLQPFLPTGVTIGSFFNVTCSIDNSYSNLGIQMYIPQGIPLSLPNNDNNDPLSSRSFPFQNQVNYTVPLVGVALSFANVSLANDFGSFDVRVTCGIDKTALGLQSRSESDLDKIYELPKETSFVVHFTNSAL